MSIKLSKATTNVIILSIWLGSCNPPTAFRTVLWNFYFSCRGLHTLPQYTSLTLSVINSVHKSFSWFISLLHTSPSKGVTSHLLYNSKFLSQSVENLHSGLFSCHFIPLPLPPCSSNASILPFPWIYLDTLWDEELESLSFIIPHTCICWP